MYESLFLTPLVSVANGLYSKEMGLGKWILGGLGFTLGGPLGAIIGWLIGSMFESDSKAIPEGGSYRRATRGSQRPTQGDIRISILVLISCVMKADGHVRRDELNIAKRFLLQQYGEEGAKEALQILKKLLEQNINYVEIAAQIRQFVNYSTRLEIVHLLLDLAYADQVYTSQEEYVISRTSDALGLTQADYRSLLALYGKQKDPNWAYQALEIEPLATDDEVKKAYRRMAMKYHPDKVASAGEDIRKKATEKFRAINEAYEYIKTLRGLN